MYTQIYKSFVASILMLSFSCAIAAQTNVAGEVSGIWTKSSSPYIVTDDLLIRDGSTLEIEPGVIVQFNGYYELKIEGTLIAAGAANDSIFFNAAQGSNWHGVKLNNSWSGASGSMEDNDSSLFIHCVFTSVNNYNEIGGVFDIRAFSKVRISGCRIMYNTSGYGAITVLDASPCVTKNRISFNNANQNGGAIYLDNSDALIAHNIITYNGLTDSPQGGGGIYMENSTPRILNNLIANNRSYSAGGGIACYYSSDAMIINNTICFNQAYENSEIYEGLGGGISCISSSPLIINSILWANSDNRGYDQIFLYYENCFPEIRYCNIQGGLDSIDGFDNYGENPDYEGIYENNLSLAPLFKAQQGINFGLNAGSPCINTGMPDTTGLMIPAYDLLNNLRISDSCIDMGAVEFQGVPSNRVPSITPMGDIYTLSGTPVSLTVSVFDPDEEDTHTLIVTSDNGNVLVENIAGSTPDFSYDLVPQGTWTGSALITVIVSDNSGEANTSVQYTYTLNVSESICGNLYGNNIWNRDTVNVSCDVVVLADAVLTIAPGTVVLFEEQAGIYIYGKLIAEGTEGDSILFTAADTVGFNEYGSLVGWGGLKFFNNQNDTSIISHCRFHYGKIYDPDDMYNPDKNAGGGVYISGYRYVLIENSQFSNNYAYGGGGAIAATESKCIIRNNKIMANRSYRGATISLALSQTLVQNNIIAFNTAGNGGGISCSDSVIISGNYICNNKITDTGARGGGILCSGRPVIINNIISNNERTGGGGTSHGGGIYFSSAYPILVSNNVIANNRANLGGAISCWNSSVTIENSIIWGNYSGSEIISGTTRLKYCFFNDTQGDSYIIADHVYDLDPGFAAPSGGYGVAYDGLHADWSLSDSSYCINSGNPDTDISKIPIDIGGNSRLIGNAVDIGAWEFTGSVHNRRPVLTVAETVRFPSDSYTEVVIGIWDPDQGDTHSVNATVNDPNIELAYTLDSAGVILQVHSMNHWSGSATVTVLVDDNSGQDNSLAEAAITIIVDNGVCGEILTSTWGADTIRVNCNITLQDGAVLTILPGTCVEFQDNYEFEVVGVLRALGTEAEPILFTAKDTITGWNGIAYKNGFYAYWHDPGIMDDNDSSYFDHCWFEHCSGEAVFIDDFSKIRISNSVFRFNKRSAIHTYEASPEIVSNIFSENEAPAYESGIIWLERYSEPMVRGNIIRNNITEGGAINCDYYSPATLINNLIHDNQGASGGGIVCLQSSPLIVNNTITRNTAYNGGGIYNYYSHSKIYNSIIWGNTGVNGNEIYSYGYDPEMAHCIMGTDAGDIYPADDFLPGNTVFSVDPEFVDPANDFHLASNSYGINMGLNEIQDFIFPEYDIHGNLRKVDSIIDIGAYEFQGVPVQLPPINISLDRDRVYENSPSGTVVGNFSVKDPNWEDTHIFSLISGDGINDLNNSDFSIAGDTLKTLVVFDHELTPTCSIYVQATDQTGLSCTNALIIEIADRNEPPILLNPIPDQRCHIDSALLFQIPENTFFRDDLDHFTYSASLEGIDSLPSWMNLNSFNGIFSGNPVELKTYSIIVTVADWQYTSEPDTFQIEIFEDNVDLKEYPLSENITVYPNPFWNTFYIKTGQDILIHLSIFDSMGRLILRDILQKDQHVYECDLSGYPEGIYFVNLNFKNQNKSFKILKE